MRKLFTIIAAVCTAGSVFAGGLVTNTNQSSLYTRLQSRNASTLIDAVYYNPAGVTRLGSGIFLSLNNQSVWQTTTVLNDYTYLAGKPREYTGKVKAPLFPGIYAAANLGKLSVSAGVNPIGGGGGAKYETGLPSFEMPISDLVPLLASQKIPATQYAADIYFEGTSVYMGYQVNVAYKLNDIISAGVGLRVVSAKNTYKGNLLNISINPNFEKFGEEFKGSMVKARTFFTAGETFFNSNSALFTGTASKLQPIITGGGGSLPLAQGANVGMKPEDIQGIQALLAAIGLPADEIAAIDIQSAQGYLNTAGEDFLEKAGAMREYAGATADRYVDAAQTGTGYSPILSLNISPVSNLNIGIKYEFKTKLNLLTKVYDGKGGGVFTDRDTTIADMPAMLAAGFEFRPIETFMVTGSANIYFDKKVDYDGSKTKDIKMIDKNFTEYALGVELGLTPWLKVSGGWLGTFTGVNSDYQNDQRFSLNTNSVGAGLGIELAPMVSLNVGGQYTTYKEGSKNFNHMLGQIPVPVTEKYNKNTMVIGAGLDFHFGLK